MRLKISPKPVIMAEMDSGKFRHNLNKFPGLRKPLENSLVIKHIDEKYAEQGRLHNEDINKIVRGLVYFNINWRVFLEFMADDKIVVPDTIKFNFHEVKCDGKPQFEINRVNKIIFSEADISLANIELKLKHINSDLMMISNFPRAYESQLEMWLARDVLLYGEAK